MEIVISENAASLVVIDEVIQGHKSDIIRLTLEMAEMRMKSGWFIKIPGFGYDKLTSDLQHSKTQLLTVEAFREAFLNNIRTPQTYHKGIRQ